MAIVCLTVDCRLVDCRLNAQYRSVYYKKYRTFTIMPPLQQTLLHVLPALMLLIDGDTTIAMMPS
jgi:uncharacterized membrane protein SirB2